MKERVVFEANVPVTATLAYPDGLKVQGRFGDQVMYSLTDGRVMYVPPMVRDKLVELGIRQNEPFAICRAERREGNRRFVDWVVKPDGSAAPAQSATATVMHPARRRTATAVRASRRMATATVTEMASRPAHQPVQDCGNSVARSTDGEHRRSSCSGTIRVRAWTLDPLRQRRPACHGAQPVHPARPRRRCAMTDVPYPKRWGSRSPPARSAPI